MISSVWYHTLAERRASHRWSHSLLLAYHHHHHHYHLLRGCIAPMLRGSSPLMVAYYLVKQPIPSLVRLANLVARKPGELHATAMDRWFQLPSSCLCFSYKIRPFYYFAWSIWNQDLQLNKTSHSGTDAEISWVHATSVDVVKSKTHAAVASMLSIEMELTVRPIRRPHCCSFTREYTNLFTQPLFTYMRRCSPFWILASVSERLPRCLNTLSWFKHRWNHRYG